MLRRRLDNVSEHLANLFLDGSHFQNGFMMSGLDSNEMVLDTDEGIEDAGSAIEIDVSSSDDQSSSAPLATDCKSSHCRLPHRTRQNMVMANANLILQLTSCASSFSIPYPRNPRYWTTWSIPGPSRDGDRCLRKNTVPVSWLAGSHGRCLRDVHFASPYWSAAATDTVLT
jgi:hypothetical protein